jgi:hypothetical protein
MAMMAMRTGPSPSYETFNRLLGVKANLFRQDIPVQTETGKGKIAAGMD